MIPNRWIGLALAALVVAGAAAWAGWSGLRTCGWLDRGAGRSGCHGTVRVDGVLPPGTNATVPLGDKVAVIAELRTADGWRNGLIVLDPATGEEAGRYPMPLRHANVRAFVSPDGSELLLVCGFLEGACSESGGSAVLFSTDDLTVFADFPLEDRYLRVFPGMPLPAEEFGHDAVFAAGGGRIVAREGRAGLVLRDANGDEIAPLVERRSSRADLIVSPDGGTIALWEREGAASRGDRLRFWDARDGGALGTIEGDSEWHLRSAPFWSADGATIFMPRSEGGTMLLDRFSAPTADKLR
ncbi:hypothetical protein GI374_17820 [Paracoccus sp. S-4012]|uniref:hypothetical protein n=1 Tax=Paracoccus sp. S-4012 TaxID=2665648 RepID=UPI0012AF9909|nr:hypothetical protein [Paracoccus sp. S-4012]MRX52215.1 hypothetical protein [Paracoccus sp. S-4012]